MEKTHLSARSGTSKMDSNSQNHPKVAIYSRVSTEEQAKEGLSVEAQIDKCKSFCNARDWEVFKSYKEICEKFNISTSTFYQIVKNPVYIGKIQYRGKLYDGKHKPIIDPELFYQVNPPDKTSKE